MSQLELSHSVIRNAFQLTADDIRKRLHMAIAMGFSEEARGFAISLVRVTRPDLHLDLIEEPAVWSCNAEEEESVV